MILRNQISSLKLDDITSYMTEFDSVDWQKEPTESMKELCKQRAQQIRDTFDYIVLYNSGGSDSTTVLNAFLDNDIFVDEVITVSYEGIDAPCLNGKKAELDLIQKNYKGRFNKIVLKLDDIMAFLRNDNFLIESPNFTGQIHSFARFNINYLERFGFCLPIQRQGKVCHLYGEADPWVWKESDGYYAGVNINRRFNASNFSENTGFFTDISFPQLHVKQCHILAKLIRELPHTKMTNRIVKPVIRDEFDPLISPRKCIDDPQFILKNKELYTEPTVLLSKFSKKDSFTDLYINAAYKQQFQITETIKLISSKYERKYKLFT